MSDCMKGHFDSPDDYYLCTSCSHSADCEIAAARTVKRGCNMYVRAKGPEGTVEGEPEDETPSYTVTEIIHGFEDLFRRGMSDLSHELSKHGLCVAGWNVSIHDNQSPYGNTPTVESQNFTVQLVVKSRGRPQT